MICIYGKWFHKICISIMCIKFIYKNVYKIWAFMEKKNLPIKKYWFMEKIMEKVMAIFLRGEIEENKIEI